MQDKTTKLATTSLGAGLRINHKKTKLMRINTSTNNPVTVEGNPIQEVDSFTYLGSIIDNQGGTDSDVTARKRHLTEKLRGVETERDVLLDEKERQLQSATDELEKLNCAVTSLSEERAQLQEMLEMLRQDKNELTAKLEHVTETFQTEKMYLIEKIKGIEAELESRHQSSLEELKKLNCRVKALGEERAQLRETLEEVEREKKQLETELQDKVSTMQESENKHKQSRLLQQVEARKLESDLRQEVQQLEQLKSIKENQTVVQTEATTSQQLLAEANATVAILNEKLKSCEQPPR
ncbi:nucleoprotein TPR-like [Syngnathus acus]|uniref:nucleoprotein TPR-like n=1 Tax=Syngnathus acus TaxID=161584 RepID=UPI001885B2F5|nr:nucleoprotein TPR-like [Syngnathus acus]